LVRSIQSISPDAQVYAARRGALLGTSLVAECVEQFEREKLKKLAMEADAPGTAQKGSEQAEPVSRI
jgi:hypothetical protein